jgi:hypothetical protein
MKFGHANDSFICISSISSTNIYAFGGCDNPDNSKTIERYDSVMDVWITLTCKATNSILSKVHQLLFLSSSSD